MESFQKRQKFYQLHLQVQLSMLGDKLFKFKRETNEAGFFDFVKQGLVDINKIIEKNQDQLR